MYKPRFLINTHINLRVLDIFEKDSKLARCCIHEAGHAIIDTAFGGVVESVTVDPQGGGLTTTQFNRPLDSRDEDMVHMSGYFFEALVCGRYRQPFPEYFPVYSPDIRNTARGNADHVIEDLERLVILNDIVVKAVEEIAIELFTSGLSIDGNTVREIWNRSRTIKE
jgi:hypothetical protein